MILPGASRSRSSLDWLHDWAEVLGELSRRDVVALCFPFLWRMRAEALLGYCKEAN